MRKTWISSAHQGFVTGPEMAGNTLSAFRLAAERGADMIETDARMSADGVLMVNHDPEVRGFDAAGRPVTVPVALAAAAELKRVVLAPRDPAGPQPVATLAEVLHLAYFSGMSVNIDLKEGMKTAEATAQLVCRYGMAGRVVYATNGAGPEAIFRILAIDPRARFIDTPRNFNREALSGIPEYGRRCFVYTADFSEENIRRIRESGCMLAAISLNETTVPLAFRHYPDMAEYPHTSDFAALDRLAMERFL